MKEGDRVWGWGGKKKKNIDEKKGEKRERA